MKLNPYGDDNEIGFARYWLVKTARREHHLHNYIKYLIKNVKPSKLYDGFTDKEVHGWVISLNMLVLGVAYHFPDIDEEAFKEEGNDCHYVNEESFLGFTVYKFIEVLDGDYDTQTGDIYYFLTVEESKKYTVNTLKYKPISTEVF